MTLEEYCKDTNNIQEDVIRLRIENERLQKELSENKVADMEIVNGLCNQIQDLQKENAELKRNEFNAKVCLDLQQTQDKAIVQHMGEQLAKATELLKGIINEPMYIQMGGDAYENEGYKELIIQAEQFLKEIEK